MWSDGVKMTEKEQTNLHESLFPAALIGFIDAAHILERQSTFAEPEAALCRWGNWICSYGYEGGKLKKTILNISDNWQTL